MFANLSYQDKEAFFSLLDEYFASRPNLFGPRQSQNESTLASLQNLSRHLSPSSPQASPTSPDGPPRAPKTEKELAAEQRRIDMATKVAGASIRHSVNGAQRSLGLVAGNKTAMGALDKYGVGGLVRGTNDRFGREAMKKRDQEAQQGADAAGAGGKGTPPPPPASKKSGVSGLVSGKSFGHVDTSNKMSAFTSMWKDPQKPQAPPVEASIPPALSHSKTTLPPPVRRNTGSTGNAPTLAAVATTAVVVDETAAEGQAQVLYDYDGTDTTDLQVQEGQIVNVLEKTNADWWTCEDGNNQRGLIPANYLREI